MWKTTKRCRVFLWFPGVLSLFTFKNAKMKVPAYRCDFCGNIFEADEVKGIMPIEDMFSAIESFPSTDKLDKTNVHHCIECSRVHVIIPADRECPRRKDERLYQLKFKELYYLLKSTCVLNVKNRKKFVRDAVKNG